MVRWLRRLGFRADEARRPAAHCESIPDASLEERIRAALSFLAPTYRRAETNALRGGSIVNILTPDSRQPASLGR